MKAITVRDVLVPVLVAGGIAYSLHYLSVPNDVKYSKEVAFILLGKPVTYISAYSAYFFGEFILFGVIHKLCSCPGKSKIVTFFSDVQFWTLIARGSLYVLHYLEICTTNSKERIGFILGFILLLSLRDFYRYLKERD